MDEFHAKLRSDGVVLLPNLSPLEPLCHLRNGAALCFRTIECGQTLPAEQRYNAFAHSIQLTALLDFGMESEAALLVPLSSAGLDEMLRGLLGGPWQCRLEHSWARKKFAPRNAPGPTYRIQDWHQDGALGTQFPVEPGPAIPATRLATCWIPLDRCGEDSPGLEFIRGRQPALLHFTELNDAGLRRRFPEGAFWAPAVEFGDGLVFGNDVLHRTYVTQDMDRDRISVEYRIFPA